MEKLIVNQCLAYDAMDFVTQIPIQIRLCNGEFSNRGTQRTI